MSQPLPHPPRQCSPKTETAIVYAQPRRRRRPAVACVACRKRKIRCNREMPCKNCIRARHVTCEYEKLSPPPPPRRPVADLAPNPQPSLHYPSPALTANSGAATPPAGGVSRDAIPPGGGGWPSIAEHGTMSQILQLSERLKSRMKAKAKGESHQFTINNSVAGDFHVHHKQNPGQDIAGQSITHKGRVFGQSHWINSLIPIRDIFESMEMCLQGGKTTAVATVERCKHLARVIKNQRAPPWPTPLTTELPPRDVCDRLIDCYLQVSESLYRVLHIPSFKREYEALWQPDATPSTGFLVQLKLVLAIGATVYDDTYSLRPDAVRWVYEAQTHLSEPEFKARLTIQSLQTHVLLLLARQTANIGGSLVWMSAGELLRTAMFMGLHKDPERGFGASRLGKEVRRRLWNTVLEVALQASMDSGGPPLLSMADFDTLPPADIPDESLLDESAAVTATAAGPSETSVARAFRETFPVRLAIARYLNDLRSLGTYEEALRLDKELRASRQGLSRALESIRRQDSAGRLDTASRLAGVILASYVSALHMPFLSAAFSEPAHAYSRIALLENSLRLWPAVHPGSATAARPSPAPETWRRLSVCNYRVFHVAVKQACVAIALELRAQLRDDLGVVGAGTFRGDLLDVLREVKAWVFESLGAGETNIKGYIWTALVVAYVEGLKSGLVREELSERLVGAVGAAAEKCLPVLEGMAERGKVEEEAGGVAGGVPTPEGELDWGDIFPLCQMSDVQYGLGAWDLLGGAFAEESRGEQMGGEAYVGY